jgi:glucokinase
VTRYVIGLDIGGTAIKAACVEVPSGRTLSADRVSTFATDEGWPHRVRERVAELEALYKSPAAAIAIAAPGIAAADQRSIWWMQNRLAESQGLDWTDFLGRSSLVPVMNDAHAALLGEWWKGPHHECRNLIMLTLGTGVGGAAMVDGNILRGHLGRAGHLGHISLDPNGQADIVGTPGSLEEAIGECSIERRTNGRFNSTIAMLAHLQSHDDAQIRAAWDRSVRALAAGVASLVNVLDPEIIILGGGIADAGPLLFVPLAAELDKMEWRPHGKAVRIEPAVCGEYAGAYGAARRAMEQLKNEGR